MFFDMRILIRTLLWVFVQRIIILFLRLHPVLFLMFLFFNRARWTSTSFDRRATSAFTSIMFRIKVIITMMSLVFIRIFFAFLIIFRTISFIFARTVTTMSLWKLRSPIIIRIGAYRPTFIFFVLPTLLCVFFGR